MKMEIDQEFISICQKILDEQKSKEEWAEIESDDMFQTGSFEGGYDATEEAFCFSYYNENQDEFWFQLTLDEITEIVNGTKTQLDVRPGD
jgi:hypothetical protein